MRKIFVLSSILFCTVFYFNSCVLLIPVAAKKQERTIEKYQLLSQRLFDAKEMELLKSSKSIFFLRPQDMKEFELFEKAIQSSWSLTDVEIREYGDVDDLEDDQIYSFFIINAYCYDVTNENGAYSVSHSYLTLEITTKEKILKRKKITEELFHYRYFRAGLFMDNLTEARLSSNLIFSNYNNLYDTIFNPIVKNWTPTHIFLYLKEAQANLLDSKRDYAFEKYKDEFELNKLQSEILYVPDYVLAKFDKKTGYEDERHDPLELFSKYPFRYKFISMEDLNEKVLAGENIYILDYVKDTDAKFVRVYNTKNGLIYQDNKKGIYNIKKKDINGIF